MSQLFAIEPIVLDNKLFWKNVKPHFSNKGDYGSKIKLVEKEEIIDDDTKIAGEINNFFKKCFSVSKYSRKSTYYNKC